MNQHFNPSLKDIQFRILETIYKTFRGEYWPTTWAPLCNQIRCDDDRLVHDALKLLADKGQIVIKKYLHNPAMDWVVEEYTRKSDLWPFLMKGDFRIYATELGREQYEDRRSGETRNLGTPAANQVVRDTVTRLSDVLSLDQGSGRQICIRILEELVRIAVRNYQDRAYLRDHVQRFLEQSGMSPRKCEEHFYQPFLRTELQRDELLAGRVVADAAMAGGYVDIMSVGQIPIEAKVIYPDDNREDSNLCTLGVGQTARYSPLSRIGFLSVLDLRPRNSVADLSSIQDDVEVKSQLSGDGRDIIVVRVQHLCGFSTPSSTR